MSKTRFFKHLSCTLSGGLSSIHLPLASCKPRFTYRCTKPSSSYPSVRWFSSLLNVTSLSPPPVKTASSLESSAYLTVRIRCPKNVADDFSEALLCFGASSASMEEEGNVYETSDEVFIDSIFTEGQDIQLCLSQATNSIGLNEIPPHEVKVGEQYDWVRKTQDTFLPVQVTDGLWIVPEWKSPPDVQAVNIVLNPGLAFGTGEHPTTKLCLLLLKGLIKGGECFLDYGTGSGILAIAALKLGAALSVGFDVDPQAIASAGHNAALNNIKLGRLELHLVPGKNCSPLADGIMKEQSPCTTGIIGETEKYDVVIANILLNPLLELAEQIVSYAKPGGVVGLSGIISKQSSDIVDRYSFFLQEISVSELDGWACISGMKKTEEEIVTSLRTQRQTHPKPTMSSCRILKRADE